MATEKKSGSSKKVKPVLIQVKEVPEQFSKGIIAVYNDFPSATKNKKIHPRQQLPPVLKGKKIADETPTRSIKIDK